MTFSYLIDRFIISDNSFVNTVSSDGKAVVVVLPNSRILSKNTNTAILILDASHYIELPQIRTSPYDFRNNKRAVLLCTSDFQHCKVKVSSTRFDNRGITDENEDVLSFVYWLELALSCTEHIGINNKGFLCVA